jgi:hypothetical protein
MSVFSKVLPLIVLVSLGIASCGSDGDAAAEIKRIRENQQGGNIVDHGGPAPIEDNDGDEAEVPTLPTHGKPEVPVPPKGLCQTPPEFFELMKGDNIVFARDMEQCVVTDVWAASAHLDTGCLKGSYANMADGCLDCFAKLTKCVADSCTKKCGPWPIGYGSNSDECELCSIKACHGDHTGVIKTPPGAFSMWECSGIKSPDLPRLR